MSELQLFGNTAYYIDFTLLFVVMGHLKKELDLHFQMPTDISDSSIAVK